MDGIGRSELPHDRSLDTRGCFTLTRRRPQANAHVPQAGASGGGGAASKALMSRLPATPPAGRRRAAGSFPRRRSPRFPQAAPGSAPDPRCPAAAPAAGPLPRGRLRPAGRSWRRRPGCGPELWRDRSAAVRTVGGRPAGHQRLLQLERPEGVDEPCPSASPSGCVATCRTGSRILASRSPRSARWRNREPSPVMPGARVP